MLYRKNMKYKLPHPSFNPKAFPIVEKEIEKQDLPVTKATEKQLKELSQIDKAILEKEIPDHLVCMNLPKNLGKGIFLKPEEKPIQKGTLIGSYSGKGLFLPQNLESDSDYIFSIIGEILLTKEEQKKLDPKRKFHPKRHYALEVDAKNSGNFTRFINHSEKPNIEARFLKIPKNRFGIAPNPIEVIYVAKKTIKPGEQLLVSYEEDGDSYWGSLNIEPLPIFPSTITLMPDHKLKFKKI